MKANSVSPIECCLIIIKILTIQISKTRPKKINQKVVKLWDNNQKSPSHLED